MDEWVPTYVVKRELLEVGQVAGGEHLVEVARHLAREDVLDGERLELAAGLWFWVYVCRRGSAVGV